MKQHLTMNMSNILRLAVTAIVTLSSFTMKAGNDNPEKLKQAMTTVKQDLSESIREALDNLDDTVFYINGHRVNISSVASDSALLADTSGQSSALPIVSVSAPIYVTEPSSSIPAVFDSLEKCFIALGLIALPIIIIYIICSFNFKQVQERNRLIEMAITKDYKLPEEYFMPRHISTKRFNIDTQSNGINRIAWGVGFFIFFLLTDVPFLAALSLIPIIIGVSKVVKFKNHDKDKKDIEESDSHQKPPTPPTPPSVPTF